MPDDLQAGGRQFPGREVRPLAGSRATRFHVPGAAFRPSRAAVRACVADGFTKTPDGNQLPLVETLTGTEWRIRGDSQPCGAPGAIVDAVSCPAVVFCVLAGQVDTPGVFAPLFESWNGKVFTRINTPAPAGVTAHGVSCVSAKSCVAVDDAVNFADFTCPFTGGRELVSVDGGEWR